MTKACGCSDKEWCVACIEECAEKSYPQWEGSEAQKAILDEYKSVAGQSGSVSAHGVCPHCGYCPTCGRRSVGPTPWYPWTRPFWYVDHTGAWGQPLYVDNGSGGGSNISIPCNHY